MCRWFLAVLVALGLAGCGGSGDTILTGGDTGSGRDFDTSQEVSADVGREDLSPVDTVPEIPREDIAGESQLEAGEELWGCETGSGCFGDPCNSAGDCISGLCLDHMGDMVCSDFCTEECPPGWTCGKVAGPDILFACVSDFPRLCRPCSADSDCLPPEGKEGRCVSYGDEGTFCAAPCGAGGECPEGFKCKDAVAVDGVVVKQCVSLSGACECSKTAIGLALATPCSRANELGECKGLRVCGEAGLGDCDAELPAADECNGLDDDCDGQTDEATCDDGNACTKDGCLPLDGCMHEKLDDGICDDGDSCTLGDQCLAGSCVGAPVACDDGNPCTQDVCDGQTGCKFPAAAGPCDDDDPCTFGDYCEAGACKSGVAIQCDDGNQCTKDACDETEGCAHDPMAGNCDDGNACTQGDSCAGGKCGSGAWMDCDDDNPCTSDWCDGKLGCQHAPSDAPCDDSDFCTIGDKCAAGDCQAGPPLDCSDGNGCTTDSCNPLLGCKHTNSTAPCDDSDPCTMSDACVGGSCVGTGAPDCDDGNACTVDFCEPMAGCTHQVGAGSCDDGNPCTFGDKCQAGKCVGGPKVACDDGNGCTDDSCDPLSGCKHVPNAEPCDDANACTADDHCSGGKCASSQPLLCNDSNPCTTDYCLPDGGCQFQVNQAPCSDGDLCTAGDVCAAGKCQLGAAVVCDDGNVCTADSCDKGVCKHVSLDGGQCNDINMCTTGDKCQGGVCVGQDSLACDDGNVCTTDSCLPKTGCLFSLNDVACSDGDYCTVGDQCVLGQCAPGAPLQCNDLNVCTSDACKEGVGCVFTAMEGDCSDGNSCTSGDHCQGGMCAPSQFVSCDDGNVCTKDSCDLLAGCVHENASGPCDDGSACTVSDSCSAGSCTPGAPLQCNDGKGCTVDQCDPDLGCVYPPIVPCCGNLAVEAGEECDDGNTTAGDGCDAACKSEVVSAPECKSYATLSDWERNVNQNDGNGGVESCDSGISSGWYRFTGAAGTKMPTSCPPMYSCGTDAPGWMQGSHPSVQDGAVNRTVCFHWDNNCCIWSNGIQVRNCGDFYVYKFPGPPPNCTLKYCGTN